MATASISKTALAPSLKLAPNPTPATFMTFDALGIRVAAVQISQVISTMSAWIEAGDPCRFVAATSMHGLVEARRDPDFRRALDSADLVVPDGMPLVWLARTEGLRLERRVYGPELMETLCRETGGRFRHFLYGGTPGVADILGRKLENDFGCNVVGTHSPPFGPVGGLRLEDEAQLINRTQPDVVWVGLSTPKQETFIHKIKEQLDCPIAVSVGAAFDFLSGTKQTAPTWMQENGLEWLFRLKSEPARLWRRYLVGGPLFAAHLAVARLSKNRTASEPAHN